MIFKDILEKIDTDKFESVLEKWRTKDYEKKEYLSFIERLKELTPVKDEGELVYILGDKSEDESDSVGVKKEGTIYALDFAPWENVLGYSAKEEEIQKTDSLEEFAFHVLYDISFDGFYQEQRDENINEILSRAENDDKEIYYIAKETIQGENDKLISGEIYTAKDVSDAGLNLALLLFDEKMEIEK